jgi:hypothetical protein
MMPSSFVHVVSRFRSRREKAFGESHIDAVEEGHRFLRVRYRRDPLLKDMLDSMKDTSPRVVWLPSIQERRVLRAIFRYLVGRGASIIPQ